MSLISFHIMHEYMKINVIYYDPHEDEQEEYVNKK